MIKLNKAQLITRACEDVDSGLSLCLASLKWNVSAECINSRIEYDCSEDGLYSQQAQSEHQH